MVFSVIEGGLSSGNEGIQDSDIQFRFLTGIKGEHGAKHDDYLAIRDKRHPNGEFEGYPIIHSIDELKEIVKEILRFTNREKKNHKGSDVGIAFGKVDFYGNDIPARNERELIKRHFPVVSDQDISEPVPMLSITSHDFMDGSKIDIDQEIEETDFGDYYFLIPAVDTGAKTEDMANMDIDHNKIALFAGQGIIFQLYMFNQWASYRDISGFEPLDDISNTGKPLEKIQNILDGFGDSALKESLELLGIDGTNMTPGPGRVITLEEIQEILKLDFAHSWIRPLKRIWKKIRKS